MLHHVIEIIYICTHLQCTVVCNVAVLTGNLLRNSFLLLVALFLGQGDSQTMSNVFISIALLFLLPFGRSGGSVTKGKPVPQYDYLCRNAVGHKVCHPIFEDRYIQCSNLGKYETPHEFSCKRGLKFSSLRQKCSFAQYGDCLPHLTPEEAALITCPRLLDPPHGKLHCSDDNRYDSLCLLACMPGYTMQGVLAVRCVLAEDHGRWSGEPGHCVKDPRDNSKDDDAMKPVQCETLNDVDDGKVTCTRRSYTDSVCSLRCASGLEVFGRSRATCMGNGKWDHQLGDCRKPVVKCPVVKGDDVVCDDVKCDGGYCHVGAACNLKCGKGAITVGRGYATCSESGAWSHKLGHCEKHCAALKRDDATVECTDSFEPRSSCRLNCRSGFHASGDVVASCKPSGEWDVELGSCLKEKTCPKIDAPLLGDLFCSDSVKILPPGAAFKRGTQCFISCEDSYKLKGDSLITCSDSGKWSAPVGTCVSKCDINDLPSTKHGHWVCSGDSNLDCQFQCDSRKTPETSIVSCFSGMWSSFEVPSCAEQKKCPKIEAPEGGSLKCSNKVFQNGTRCNVECDSGYELRGSKTTVCVEGKWHNKLGSCESKCNEGQLSDKHGKWTCMGRGLLTCELTCEEGYEVVEPMASCSNGKWRKSFESVCIKSLKYCPLLSPPKDVSLICNSR